MLQKGSLNDDYKEQIVIQIVHTYSKEYYVGISRREKKNYMDALKFLSQSLSPKCTQSLYLCQSHTTLHLIKHLSITRKRFSLHQKLTPAYKKKPKTNPKYTARNFVYPSYQHNNHPKPLGDLFQRLQNPNRTP